MTVTQTAKQLLNEEPMKLFMPRMQRHVIEAALDGEEGQWFAERIIQLKSEIDLAPVTYAQDGLGMASMVHFHFFRGPADVWVTELDVDGKVDQAYGWVDLGHGAGELGYVSIREATQEAHMELDLHWKPKTLAEVLGK